MNTEGIQAQGVWNVEAVRADFPALQLRVREHPLVYLDNAATSQKPYSVLNALEYHYTHQNANVHRGVHFLADQADQAYEKARTRVADYLGAERPQEVIFVRGTTEAINLVAECFLAPRIRPGEVILLTLMEHHANIVPWQRVAARTGAHLQWVPVTPLGELDLDACEALFRAHPVRLFAFTQVSHVLGTVNPLERLVQLAQSYGAAVMVDGAQAAVHSPAKVAQWGVDFYAFSGHKTLGPTGIGVLYGKSAWLAEMPPYQSGGGMIEQVTCQGSTFAMPPGRFEAGTPPIAQAIGLGAALEYLTQQQQRSGQASYQKGLEAYARDQLQAVSGLHLMGGPTQAVPVFSFQLEGVHPHDLATFIDYRYGIALRAGHHCAQPLMNHWGVTATARASFLFYNTFQEVDLLVQALREAKRALG